MGLTKVTYAMIEGAVINPNDYGSLADAITAAIAQNNVVGLLEDTTIRVPTDAATLQIAFDRITPLNAQCQIDVVIQTGHQPVSGVSVENGDYSQWQISSVDAEVTLASTFPATDVIKGVNARMPRLNCLINANGEGVNGYFADQGSIGYVSADCGIKYAAQQACYANAASTIYAPNTIWTYASQSANTYSGILAWGSIIYAEGADVSYSAYYGAQAAAGGTLSFRDGIASNTGRYGVRATNQGKIDARRVVASNNALFGIYAYRASHINAMGAQCDNNTEAGVVAVDASFISFMNDDASGAFGPSCDGGATAGVAAQVYAGNGAIVACSTAELTNSGGVAIKAETGGKIVANQCDISGAAVRAVEANSGEIDISVATINGAGSTGGIVRSVSGNIISRGTTYTSPAAGTPFFVNDGGVIILRPSSTLDGNPIVTGDTNVAAFNAFTGSGAIFN
jgi:3D (Asp-Asp-Asp) domain-containing protein